MDAISAHLWNEDGIKVLELVQNSLETDNFHIIHGQNEGGPVCQTDKTILGGHEDDGAVRRDAMESELSQRDLELDWSDLLRLVNKSLEVLI